VINSPKPFPFPPMTKPGTHTRRVAALLLLSVACCGVARGRQASKLAETENTRCDFSEVWPLNDLGSDILAEITKRPEARAAVVVYGPQAGDAMRYGRQAKRWLTEARGILAESVLAVYSGYAVKRRLEIWRVPAAAEAPRAAPPVPRAAVTLFDIYYYYPGEVCPEEREPSLEVFAETLKRLPGWRGTVVVRPHANPRSMKPWADGWDAAALTRRQALRRAAEERLRLVRHLGVDPARIRAVVGESGKYAHAELWLIPPAAAKSGGR
jgi:hypothetical protein